MVAPPGENAMDIDSSSTKRKNKKPKYSNAEAALRCAFAVLEKRIISNPNDQIGILLYGTEQTKHPGGESSMYPNCYLLLDLDVPDAASIKELKFLIESTLGSVPPIVGAHTDANPLLQTPMNSKISSNRLVIRRRLPMCSLRQIISLPPRPPILTTDVSS